MIIGIKLKDSDNIIYDGIENFYVRLDEVNREVEIYKHNGYSDIIDIDEKENYLGHLLTVVGMSEEDFVNRVRRV